MLSFFSLSPIVNFQSSILNTFKDSKAYQKQQQERYKNELAQQIEEKNRLKIERKIEEEKEEKKLEWKAKQEEEKLRLEFEREQAEIAYRAAQVKFNFH